MNATKSTEQGFFSPAPASLNDVWAHRHGLLMDGGFGTMILGEGLASIGQNFTVLNVTEPDAILAIHQAYAQADAQVTTANTFTANGLALKGAATVDEVFAAAAELVREAGTPYAAADVGPLGELMEPWGDLTEDEVYELFAEQARAIAGRDFDFVALETFSDVRELEIAIKAVRDFVDLPLTATMSFGAGERTFTGVTPQDAARTLTQLGVQALGCNCSQGPEQMVGLIRVMAAETELTVMAQPNAGLPRLEGTRTVYDLTADEFAASMREVAAAGAAILGGCCGTDPTYIAALRQAMADVR